MVKISKKLKQLIESVAVALATCDLNCTPHVITVACLKVVSRNQILITDNFMIRTAKNIQENNRISIAVWSKNEEEGYQLKGTTEYLTKGKWKQEVDKMECNKGLAHKAAILFTVKEIYNLANPGLICKEN